ncbi:MAG: alpha/beta fold hydrolase [Pseudomonadota bacterium]
MSRLDVAGRRVTFTESGRAELPPVILLHGGGFDQATLSWRDVLPDLAADHHVIAPDFPGYGGSAGFDGPFTVADLGAWLVRFLDALGVSRASVVGVSMGGAVGLWLALREPQRVDRLVPVSAYGLADRVPAQLAAYGFSRLPLARLSYAWMASSRRATRRALEQSFADPSRLTDDLVATVQAIIKRKGSGRAFRQFQAGELQPRRLTTYFLPELPRLQRPTRFVHGGHDHLIPIAAARAAAAAAPDATLDELNTGHLPMHEAPEVFVPLVRRLLTDEMPR